MAMVSGYNSPLEVCRVEDYANSSFLRICAFKLQSFHTPCKIQIPSVVLGALTPKFKYALKRRHLNSLSLGPKESTRIWKQLDAKYHRQNIWYLPVHSIRQENHGLDSGQMSCLIEHGHPEIV